jgi:hypothetical protein
MQSRWTDDLRMYDSHREAWRCDGALLVTLSVIYLEFKAHLTSMATTAAICHPIWFAVSGTIICFSTRQWPQDTSRLCNGYLTKKESDWELASTITQPQANWDGLDRRVKEKQPTSAQHMWELIQDCSKSIPGDECQECAKHSSRQRVDSLTHFLVIS